MPVTQRVRCEIAGRRRRGKVFAGGHRPGPPDADRNENLAVAQRMQQVAGFVVFREAGRIEGAAGAGRGETLQGGPVEACAHPV